MACPVNAPIILPTRWPRVSGSSGRSSPRSPPTRRSAACASPSRRRRAAGARAISRTTRTCGICSSMPSRRPPSASVSTHRTSSGCTSRTSPMSSAHSGRASITSTGRTRKSCLRCWRGRAFSAAAGGAIASPDSARSIGELSSPHSKIPATTVSSASRTKIRSSSASMASHGRRTTCAASSRWSRKMGE